jgi:hypothetical protein
MRGEEREAANLFRELLRRSVRSGLLEAMAGEAEALCGPRHHPEHQSPCHRAGSESGIACLDGGKEEIRRPRVRHESDGEVRLATCEAASSPLGRLDEIVAWVVPGLPVPGVERVTGEICVVVAVGIDITGHKRVWDFEPRHLGKHHRGIHARRAPGGARSEG